MELDANHVITSETALRDHYKPVMQKALDKQLDRLDEHCRAFIERSPFLCIATSSPDGYADNSPKGDEPGFVRILDERTLGIPDRMGNNRLDTISNLLTNPQIGLIFFIPGVDETLRVNGRAEISVDPSLLAPSTFRDKAPTSMIVVHIEEAYLHCPKALIRSTLWQRAAAGNGNDKPFPTLTKMLSDQLGTPLEGEALAAAEKEYERRIEETLY